jgi:hypothetical protein
MTEYNKIISTVNSLTQDLTVIPDQNDVIIIDTSNTRFGINTLNPRYSIDVSGIIYSDKLITKDISLTGILKASSIDFSGIPDISTGLTNGYLYKDNGFIKIKV